MEQRSLNSYPRFMPYVAAGVGAGAAAYLIYRWFSANAAHKTQTIPDVEGHYDIDGVSFDSEGVIVSGDETKYAFTRR